ncbi:hyaluronidase PH-20-like isoform X4 [Equus asinus]|uniref:hyaluronidase PH-20-like isoform X4 n=1 Tax=Equus asinus TaxID=9793 RepID=UPI0038F7F66D
MGVLRIQHGFVGSSGTSQVVFTFLLIPCCLTVDFRAPPIFPNTPFLWAWNAPTDVCAEKFNVSLDLSLFSLVGSPRVNVTGQNITLFYSDRLGYYPYIEAKTGKLVNGGLPQSASLPGHLEKAKADISYYIPTDHVGLAVIDWEEWRPTWVRNWQAKDIYRQQSILLVQEENVQLNLTEATNMAKTMFEKAGKSFMLETLKLGKSLKPNHLWGFYLFPECYNHYKGSDYNGSCYDIEKIRNDGLDWLWNESTALYPAIHLNSKLKSSPLAGLFVRNRVQEAIRVSKLPSAESPLPIFTYTRPVFSDKLSEYLSQQDLISTIGESAALGAAGFVIWGDMNLTSSEGNCTKVKQFVSSDLGRYIVNVTRAAEACSLHLCRNNGRCLRKVWKAPDYLHLNPASYYIEASEDGEFIVEGKASDTDLAVMAEKFSCQCCQGYEGADCREMKTADGYSGLSSFSGSLITLYPLFLAGYQSIQL